MLERRKSFADRGAFLTVRGSPDPHLFDDVDKDRLGRSRRREEDDIWLRQVTERLVNWCIVGCPTEGWAKTVFGEPDEARLFEAIRTVVRLDEDDPVAAWRSHVERLERRAQALNERRFDSLRFRGPGTDLTVGLHPGSNWSSAREDTVWGRSFVPNLPTEEVFTTPDARRTEGVVRSTRPLFTQGTIVEGLEMRFAGGRIEDVSASAGEEVMRAQVATDEGSRTLGEVALVDGGSRVGQTGITFYDTLFDENATSHIAYGQGFAASVEGADDLSREDRDRAGDLPVLDPHGLHDRRPRGRGRRRHPRGRGRAAPSRRRLAARRVALARGLKRTFRTSPSATSYVFPSSRMSPRLAASACEPHSTSASQRITSARMKPCAMSVWISAAASSAVRPAPKRPGPRLLVARP